MDVTTPTNWLQLTTLTITSGTYAHLYVLPYAQFFLFHLQLLSYMKLGYFLFLNPFLICRKAPKMMPKWAWLLAVVGVAVGSPQSNYNLQDLNIEFEGEGLPEFGTLDGTVTELGKLP